MEARYLMIGDWVNYRGTFIKVTSLYDKGGSNEIGWGQLESTWVNGICIEPIPLTKEILEKNGFEKCNVDDDGAVQYEFGDDNLGIDLWVSMPCLLGAWRKWKGMEKSYNMINEFPIRYVHELQHALRLCGIEKEIEL